MVLLGEAVDGFGDCGGAALGGVTVLALEVEVSVLEDAGVCVLEASHAADVFRDVVEEVELEGAEVGGVVFFKGCEDALLKLLDGGGEGL